MDLRVIGLNNGTTYQILGNIGVSETVIDTITTTMITMKTVGYNQGELESIFTDTVATAKISLLNMDQTEAEAEFVGYNQLYGIAIDYANKSYNGMPMYTLTMVKPVSIEEQLKSFQANYDLLASQIKSLSSEVTLLQEETVVDVNTMEVSDAIKYLVAQSKTQLEEYLEAHPIVSNVHNETSATYTVTEEKRNWLTSMILMTQMAAEEGLSYTPSWNATGEPCTYDWTITELKSLAFEMEAYVRPLISLQQTLESEIRKATTTEEAIAIAVPFSTYVKEKATEA